MKYVDPCSDPDWDRVAASHPDFDLFHSAAWANVIRKTYNHTPLYLRYYQGDALAALVPLMEVRSRITGCRGVSLPSTDYCDPLVFGDCDLKLLTRKLGALAEDRRWRYFEVRGPKELASSVAPSATFYGHTLDLGSDVGRVFAAFTSATRRAIRKAEQSCLKVEIAHSREAMLEFYRLHMRTRRRHGLPPQSMAFFLNIYQEIIEPRRGFIVRVTTESHTVAAAVFFQMGRKALYKFGASDERFQGLRANNLMIWEAIKFIVPSGVESLNFGRTSVDNEGLRRFKLGWGAKEEPMHYFRFNTASATWTAASDHRTKFHTKVFSRLPLVVNRAMGTLIYPHMD